MRLEIEYRKEQNGEIVGNLEVTHSEDFPTKFIFSGVEDWPERDTFDIREQKVCAEVEAKFASASEAEIWVETQVAALRGKLATWRNIYVPNGKALTI